MTIHKPFLRKVFWFVVSVFLCVTTSKAQDPGKTITIDTSELSIYWDSSQVRLNKSVADKDYWLNILKEDTTLISFFKTRMNHKPCYVYIASVERIIGSSFQRKFLIYSRPMTINPKDLSKFGYADYLITLARTLNGGHIISSVDFTGIVF